jgi:hypothetical protein
MSNLLKINSKEFNLVPVVINECYGGFDISADVLTEYNKKTNKDLKYCGVNRTDPILIDIIRKLGKKSFAKFAYLSIYLIPDFMLEYYDIKEYDGLEHIVLLPDKYKIDQIRIINNSDYSPEKKFKKINKILDLDIPGPFEDNPI